MASVMLQIPFKSDLNSKEKVIRSVYLRKECVKDLKVDGFHNAPIVIYLRNASDNYSLFTNVQKS
jgi:hypothetical protein